MHRLVTSWIALAILLAALLVGSAVTLTGLQRQLVERTNTRTVETAKLVASLVVHRNIAEGSFDDGQFSLSERQDMDTDIAELMLHARVVGIEVWNKDGRLLYADPNHPAEKTDLRTDELARSKLGQPWIAMSADHAERGLRTLEVFLPYTAGVGEGHLEGTVQVLIAQEPIANGISRSTRQLYAVAVPLMLAAITLLFIIRRRLIIRLREARHDPLTGLLNRGAMREEILRVSARARTTPGDCAALLVLDLDGFKAVNDTLGHPAGDALLIQVARALRDAVRPADILARLGGDEFGVLLTDLPDEITAEAVSVQMLDRFRAASFTVHGVELSVDAGVGVVLLPRHGRDADVLLRRADVAMYQAKATDVGVAVYDEANDPHDVAQLGLLAELRRAIEQNELVLHYQPKLRMHTNDVAGVEALVRWQHPTRGLLAPGAFVPIAENTALMKSLTDWVLREAIRQAAEWHKAGLTVAVAVNVSPRSLLDGDLPGAVLGLLSDAGLPAELLELEVTETAIMTDPHRAATVLKILGTLGVRVAIDDFGVGYTSLGFLKSLPVHELKIDRTFISDLLTNEKDQAITETIIALAHRLGLTVVAEGIETEEVWRRLQALNCDTGQGYHLGRPMPADALTSWLVARVPVTSARHSQISPRV